jgi:hypothetical protein
VALNACALGAKPRKELDKAKIGRPKNRLSRRDFLVLMTSKMPLGFGLSGKNPLGLNESPGSTNP